MARSQILFNAPLMGVDGQEMQVAREAAGLVSGNQPLNIRPVLIRIEPTKRAELLGGWDFWRQWLLNGPHADDEQAARADFDLQVRHAVNEFVTDDLEDRFLYGYNCVRQSVEANDDPAELVG